MTWTRPAPDRVESAAGTVLRYDGCYYAWGPPGSQDVSYIAAATAHELRTTLGCDVSEESVRACIDAGREFLGRFGTADEAKRECEGRRAQEGAA